jgi:hypothetical protein
LWFKKGLWISHEIFAEGFGEEFQARSVAEKLWFERGAPPSPHPSERLEGRGVCKIVSAKY